MAEDSEIKALQSVFEALKDLSDEGKKWVIESISKKFFPQGISGLRIAGSGEEGLSGGDAIDFSDFETVADLFSRASCKTESEKVLVVASYLQVKGQLSELTSIDIHRPLKNLGHPISNITVAISNLIKDKPSLMIQTRKSGSTKQAKKKYKVTLEGLNRAKEMINWK